MTHHICSVRLKTETYERLKLYAHAESLATGKEVRWSVLARQIIEEYVANRESKG